MSVSLIGTEKPIGEVIAATGEVFAVGGDEVERDLAVGSFVYILDEIHVDEYGKLQIRFTDGSVVNLVSDTVYVIRGYRYQKMLQKDQFSAELIKGGFRSLTGSIAKKNPDEYKIKTPTATIGVRGTIIDALLTDKGLYVSCTKGLAVVMNSAGNFTIGPTESRQYLLVGSESARPEFFVTRPSEMNVRVFTSPPGAVNIEAAKIPSKTPEVKSAPAAEAPQERIGPIGPGSTGGDTRSGASSGEDLPIQQKTGAGVYIQGGC